MNTNDFSVGEKVTYINIGVKEHGIVKEIPEHTTTEIRVVYRCNNEWFRYQDYTSQLTPIKYLQKGWV